MNDLLDHVHEVAERTLPALDAPSSAGVRRLHVVSTMIRAMEEDMRTHHAIASTTVESVSLGQFQVMTAHGCAARLAADLDAEDTPERDDERLAALDEFYAVQAATGITVNADFPGRGQVLTELYDELTVEKNRRRCRECA